MFNNIATIHYAPIITRMWLKKGKQPKIPHPGGRKLQPLTGAVDPFYGQLYAALVKMLKLDQFQQFLEGLIARNPDKKIILYTDNAKAHHVKKLVPFLTAYKDKVELEFLPKYSPD